MAAQTQLALDIATPTGDFFPTAARLQIGDILEGHSGKGFPRPLTVVGLQDSTEDIQVIYRETIAGEDHYGAFTLSHDTDVTLQPPF